MSAPGGRPDVISIGPELPFLANNCWRALSRGGQSCGFSRAVAVNDAVSKYHRYTPRACPLDPSPATTGTSPQILGRVTPVLHGRGNPGLSRSTPASTSCQGVKLPESGVLHPGKQPPVYQGVSSGPLSVWQIRRREVLLIYPAANCMARTVE